MRYTHHSSAGAHGRFTLRVGTRPLVDVHGPRVGAPQIEDLLVHPEPATFSVVTNFFHFANWGPQQPPDPIADASCRARVRVEPRVDARYVLDYNYRSHGVCSLICYEYTQSRDGETHVAECPVAPPEVEERAQPHWRPGRR